MSFVAGAIAGVGTAIGGALQGGGTAAAGKATGEASKYSADIQKQLAEAQLAQKLGQLRGLQAGQEEALGRGQDIYGTGSDQFRRDTTGTPAAISQLQELIRNRATKEQQQALSRGKLGLQQAGVRGIDAGVMAQMQSNELAESLGGRVQELALKQQLADRDKRAQFGQQQALAGMAQTLKPVEKVVGESALEKQQKTRIAQMEDQKKLQSKQLKSGLLAQAQQQGGPTWLM